MSTGRGEILPPKRTYTEYRKEHTRSLAGALLVFLSKERNLNADSYREKSLGRYKTKRHTGKHGVMAEAETRTVCCKSKDTKDAQYCHSLGIAKDSSLRLSERHDRL